MTEEKSEFRKKYDTDLARWPSHVKEMTVDVLGYMGIDDKPRYTGMASLLRYARPLILSGGSRCYLLAWQL